MNGGHYAGEAIETVVFSANVFRAVEWKDKHQYEKIILKIKTVIHV